MKISDADTSFDTSSSITEHIVEKRKRGRPRKTDYPQLQYNPNYTPLGYQYTPPRPFPITMGYNNSLYKPPTFRHYQENPFKNNINYFKGAYIYSYNQQPFNPYTFTQPIIQQAPPQPQPPQIIVKREKKKKKIDESEEYYTEQEELDPYEKLLAQKDDKFLVKFRNKSYLHCEWVAKEELLLSRASSMKVKRFKPKDPPFDPEHLKVERVITEESGSFLIKWKKLPYENSTYETLHDLKEVEGFQEQVQEFLKRRRTERTVLPLDWRPSREYFLKFTESPPFKNNNSLRSYQLEGLNWFLNRWFYRQSCIMADEMGLGKTVQTVAFINILHEKYNYSLPALVVSPLSTLIHWEREFIGWTDLRILVFHGTLLGRQMIYENEFFNKNKRLFDVIITTYETVMTSIKHLQDIKFSVLIVDEAHRLKNSNSKAVASLKALNFNHKILLSGTPLQNNLTELWSLLNFVSPSQFYCLNSFLEEYKVENSEDVERLQQLLKPLMLRRMKEDVEKSIPLKEETIIEVELTMIQKRYYRAILEKNIEFLKKNNSENAPNLLNAMMELRKCCIHPYLIKGAEESILNEYKEQKSLKEQRSLNEQLRNLKSDQSNLKVNELSFDENYKVLIHSSGKLVLLDKLLQKLFGGHKVLIFSQMTRCLDLLSDYLVYRNYKFERIDGGIRGDQRQAAIDRFSTTDVFVFLLCTRAGGVGINLTAADTVVIFDSDWNPQNDLQAQARCHRIGQTQEVKIYRLVTRNTYEREMFDKAGLKLGLDRAVLQKMSFDNTTVLKKKDAVEILLKKGAYGVLMETDDASRKFCEEDIDQILERRTKIVKHQDGGNVFSKASFQVEEEIDDPDFWDTLLFKKEQKENEGRIKRLMRKLAREGVLTNEEKEVIDREIKILEEFEGIKDGSITTEEICNDRLIKEESNEPLIKEENTAEEENINSEIKEDNIAEEENHVNLINEDEIKLVFLIMLRRGLKSLTTLKFKYQEHIQKIYSYCLSKIPNKKQKEDLMMYIDLSKEEDVKLKIYEDWCIKLLLRIQVPLVLQALLKQMSLFTEKIKGWTLEDDKRLVNYTLNHGYDNYPTSVGTEKGFFKGKSSDDLNQRIRKIIVNLSNRIEEKEEETDPFLLTLILQFGKQTEKNLNSLKKILNEKLEDYNNLVSEIMEKKKGKKRDLDEQTAYERICLFQTFFNLDEFPSLRRKDMPRKWNIDYDYKMRDKIECDGLTEKVATEFSVREDLILKRIKEIVEKSYEMSE